MKPNLVLTIACGAKYQQVAVLTHPSIKQYANKINAEFLCIDRETNTPHWNKFQIYDLLDKYNRIIYFDTDLIIRKDCPNLFDTVLEEELGLFNEGKYEPRFQNLQEALLKYQVQINDWDGSYYNTGVMVISQQHKDIFQIPTKILELSLFEQSYINLQILKSKCPVYDLDYKFNRMNLMDRNNLIGEPRQASYVIHYAGSEDHYQMLTLIENDLQEWKKSSYNYIKSLDIIVGNDLADNLHAEPTIRFLQRKRPDYDIRVITNHQHVFKHIPNLTFMEEHQLRQDCMVISTQLPVNHPLWSLCRTITANPVDLASLAALNMFLPVEDRTIKLEPYDDFGEIYNKSMVFNPTDDKWWEKLVSNFNSNLTILIGKSTFDAPSNVIDLRNELTFQKTTSLLKDIKLLVSDESYFVDIASAFSGDIILTGSTRDYVPYRNIGKTLKLFEVFFEFTPKQIYKDRLTLTNRCSIDDAVSAIQNIRAS